MGTLVGRMLRCLSTAASRQICTAARRIGLQPLPLFNPTSTQSLPSNEDSILEKMRAKIPGGGTQICLDHLMMAPLSLESQLHMIFEVAPPGGAEELECDSVVKKRRKKLNKHRHRKRLKVERTLRKKLGKV